MKRLFILLTLIITIVTTPSVVFAQRMGSQSTVSSNSHTAREEAEGKEIWEQLQSKQLECQSLTDENYGSLGEYFVGQMAGSSHEAMNTMMEKMMGKEREEQMHIVMGKRLSGCDTSASYPNSGVGFMPMMGMMQMMGGGGNPAPALSGVEGMGYGGWNNMMGSFGIFGWLSMILFWLLLILGVVALVKWLTTSSKTPLEILKDRYAKGEIDKKEFEEIKKELS